MYWLKIKTLSFNVSLFKSRKISTTNLVFTPAYGSWRRFFRRSMSSREAPPSVKLVIEVSRKGLIDAIEV